MIKNPGAPHSRNAPSLIRLGSAVFLSMGAVYLVLISLWLWFSWEDFKQAHLERLRVTAALTAGHAQNYFGFIGRDLEELSGNLGNIDLARHPEAALPLLQAFRDKHPDLGAASLLSPNGDVMVATLQRPDGKPINVLSDPSWREDFRRNLAAAGLSVNRPRIGHAIKSWVIPLRYTVRDSAGKVRYLLQTGIFLGNQQTLWANLNLPKGVVIALLREDGYLISRLPSPDPARYYSRMHSNTDLLEKVHSGATEGDFTGMGMDGLERFGSFHRLQSYPVYAHISVPVAMQKQMWWRSVQTPFYMLLGFLALGGVLYAGLAQRFARRMRTISQYLGGAGLSRQEKLPSSGVGEIDSLFENLAETQQRLKDAAQNREKMLLTAARAGTYAVRLRDHVVVAADRSFLDMLGMEEGSVVGHPWRNLLAEPTAADFSSARQLEIGGMAQLVRRFHSRNDRPLWLSLAEFDQKDETGEIIRHGLAIDVSERERLLMTVRDQSTRLQVLWQISTSRTRSEGEKVRLMLRLGMDTLDMDVAMLSEKVGDHFSPAYLMDTLGLSKAEDACPCEILCLHASGEEKSLFVADMSASGRPAFEAVAQKFGVHTYAGVPVWLGEKFYGMLVFLRQKPVEGGGFTQDDEAFMELLASWFSQMLLQHTQRQRLETQALTDGLTGLPNRRAAELRFTEEIARTKRDGAGFSIATCDLDRFKLINDNYGHGIGDEVLQQTAHIMRQALREGDWVARWGGEEFILFLHHSDRAEAVAAAERIRAAIKADPVKTSQGSMEITASFGIGVYQAGDEDISHALSESDSCLYEAKHKGRDCVVATESGGPGALWRAGMLQRALKERRIVAAYQIMVDLATHKPVADEALARLLQSDGSITAAGEFIEAAEGINLIHEVDRAVTQHAMSRCAANLTAGHDPGFAHFINLSPQFMARKDYVDELLNGAMQFCTSCNIEFAGHKPVVFEITERQLLTDFEGLRDQLQPLLDFGFRLALDDFGSGYSSFLYLAELPVSFLKIEGWMVRNMVGNLRVRSMVESMVMLAQKMNITTIAECIEDRETADMLRDMGVNWGQGYYFGRPEI